MSVGVGCFSWKCLHTHCLWIIYYASEMQSASCSVLYTHTRESTVFNPPVQPHILSQGCVLNSVVQITFLNVINGILFKNCLTGKTIQSI